MQNEYKMQIKCSHCGAINEIPFLDFKSSILSNHFFKMICSKSECQKRTMVTYAFMTLPYEYGDVPEKTLSGIVIGDAKSGTVDTVSRDGGTE